MILPEEPFLFYPRLFVFTEHAILRGFPCSCAYLRIDPVYRFTSSINPLWGHFWGHFFVPSILVPPTLFHKPTHGQEYPNAIVG